MSFHVVGPELSFYLDGRRLRASSAVATIKEVSKSGEVIISISASAFNKADLGRMLRQFSPPTTPTSSNPQDSKPFAGSAKTSLLPYEQVVAEELKSLVSQSNQTNFLLDEIIEILGALELTLKQMDSLAKRSRSDTPGGNKFDTRSGFSRG